jgi:hypothetical protein
MTATAYKRVCSRRKRTWTRCAAVLIGLLLAVPQGGASGQAGQTGQTGQATGTPQSGSSAQAATTDKDTAKKGGVYTGPTQIIVLPPVPMLDEEGRQRLDPDGKPMFYPQERQQRDKYGHPRFDEDGRPVMQTPTDLGYDENGKKIKVQKEKAPKMTPVSITRGTFTVDGVVGKVALNYDIPNLRYLYLYVPGMGVTVVSHVPFEGAKEQQAAFNGKSLMVTVEGHALELASDTPLLGEKATSAYVRIDRDFVLPSQYPQVGYGTVLTRPYGWPGSKENTALPGTAAPPLPANLKPEPQLPPCPAGQMRKGADATLPGQPPAPCESITPAPK